MDIRGIVDYMEEHGPFEKIVLIASHPIVAPVESYIGKYLKPVSPVEVIITGNIDEEVRKRDKCCDNSWTVNLNDFGNRTLSFDVD